ncbi:hypothetical protein JB92DRAFT_2787778 [Gautieria morchelliformis]|nr:hypothetical protein JB92DRAFT_2787778 [Gautieria morchelliformis]
MSRITDVSSRLGEYMLRGYVLTDEGCPICSIPMVRSPSEQTPERLFCVQCQATPNNGPVPSPVARGCVHPPSTTSASSEELSRVSTPPTEISDALSSPTFAPPPNPQEMVRRRAQSDMASAEIGKRMLRGWAMLAEECPNDSCYGVPLIRPPMAGGEKDPRKECVVCGHVYIYQRDAHGLDTLVPLQVTDSATVSVPSQNVSSRIDITTPTIGVVPGGIGRNSVNVVFIIDIHRYSFD